MKIDTIIKKYTPNVIELHAKGESLIEQSFYHIPSLHWRDFKTTIFRF